MTWRSNRQQAEVASEKNLSNLRQIMNKKISHKKPERTPSLEELYEKSVIIREQLGWNACTTEIDF